MKQFTFVCITTMATLAIFAASFFTSCNKNTTLQKNGTFIDMCANISCQNGGQCISGVCNCPIGYEGNTCQKMWADRFTGSYTGKNQCNALPSFATTITKGTSATALLFKNVNTVCTGATINATINPNHTTLDIPLQYACGNLYISGTASQSQDSSMVNMWLNIRDSAAHQFTECNVVFSRK